MRANRTYGSEGGEGESPSLPLSSWDRGQGRSNKNGVCRLKIDNSFFPEARFNMGKAAINATCRLLPKIVRLPALNIRFIKKLMLKKALTIH